MCFPTARSGWNEDLLCGGGIILKQRAGFLKTLSSLKLTLALFLIIAVICLIGTVFPQGGDLASGGQVRGSRLPPLLSPYNIFQSIWFIAAGLALCVNLVLCMRRKLNWKHRNLLMLLMHGSILLVIVGYSLGVTGLDGLMEIPEGTSVSRVILKDGSAKDLGFAVKCARFTVQYYANGMPKEYLSDLAFIKNDQVLDQAQIRVNHPARFAGMSFYQQSFQQSIAAVVLSVSDGKRTTMHKVAEGDVIPLSNGTQAQVIKIRDDLMRAGPAVKLMIESPSSQGYLWIFQNIKAIKQQVPNLFQMAPHFDPAGFRPYTFALESIDSLSITGIAVKRDPGIPLVAVGGAVFLVSLLLVYLVPRTRATVRPKPIEAASTGDGAPAVLRDNVRNDDDMRSTP